MKHRGPGSSLFPAREHARAQGRAGAAVARPAVITPAAPGAQPLTTMSPGQADATTHPAVGKDFTVAVGDWLLHQTDSGALAATHVDGTTTILALPEPGRGDNPVEV